MSNSEDTIHDFEDMDTKAIENGLSESPLTLPTFIGHRIAKERWESVDAVMYEYVLAGNGLLVRASRDEFTASLPISYSDVKGLPEVFVGIKWHTPRISSGIWFEILRHAQKAHSATEFKEEVYLINWDREIGIWRWRAAGRNSSWAATTANDELPEYSNACIELHTHPPGALNFSGADDRDESGKFRIFGILVDVHDKPMIRFRCGVYDHLIQIPSAWVGHLPSGVLDLNEVDSLIQIML